MNNEKLSKSKSKSIKLSDIKNGGLTGFFTILLIQPFQVIKTSMIIIYNKQKRVRMMDIVKQIKTEEGATGFYRGFLPSVVKAVFGYAIFFSSLEFNKIFLKNLINSNHKSFDNNSDISILFNELKNEENFLYNSQINFEGKIKENININHNLNEIKKEQISEENNKYNGALNFAASGISRLIQASVVNPIMIIKTRSEVLGFNSYNNLIDAFKKIKHEEGFKGFYTGLKTTLMKDIPASGLFYMSYESIKGEIKSLGIQNVQIQAIISSSLTSLGLVLITNPLEVIRTRQQYQHFSLNSDHNYSGVYQGFKMIYKFEGINGYFVGISPRLMKKGLGSVIVWTTYESLKKEK